MNYSAVNESRTYFKRRDIAPRLVMEPADKV